MLRRHPQAIGELAERTGLGTLAYRRSCRLEHTVISMSSSAGSAAEPEYAGKIETLLDALVAQPRTVHYCPDCGCTMMDIPATFFLWDTDRSWMIWLPVCPQCQEETKGLKVATPHAA